MITKVQHTPTTIEKLNRKSATNWDKLNLGRAIGFCVEWLGYKRRNGYGMISLGTATNGYAHRVAYEVDTGFRLGAGLVVMHECDNKACVNPRHLSAGTFSQNSATVDKSKFVGRKPVNPRYHTKVTPTQVDEIRLLVACGESQRRVAGLFGLNQSAVSRIYRKR